MPVAIRAARLVRAISARFFGELAFLKKNETTFPARRATSLPTTNLPMSADDTTISVAEFLEFEFYFELAQFLRIQTRDLNRYKQLYPVEFAQCARHVLLHVCTEQCRRHILDKKVSLRSCHRSPS